MARKVRIVDVKRRHEDQIMDLSKDVTGIAIGKEPKSHKHCIVIYVNKRSPKLEKLLPKELEGFKVCIEESGEFVALTKR